MNRVRNQLKSMLRVEPCEGGFSATLKVDPDFVLFPDHFQSNPILPGICLIQSVLLAGAIRLGVSDLRLCSLKNVKFTAPVLPADLVLIDAQFSDQDDGAVLIKANLRTAEKRLAQLSLVARIDASDTEGRI